ncbi:MAG: alpha/beta fold hydrolase [Thermoleophilaceae bacterium]
MEPPRLNHRRSGSGEALVLLHGLGANLRSWAPVLMLAEAERDVLAVDLPGFGESPRLLAGIRPDVGALADAMERELDAAGLERPALAGNSLGGWIALELARRGRAASVVAISPAGMWSEKERLWADRFLRTQLAAAKLLESRAELLRNAVVRTVFLAGISARPWRADPEDIVYGLRALARSNFLPTHEAMISDRCRGLEQIGCPVLILWGTRDLLLPVRQGPRFAERIPGARLVELPGLGHVPMADDAELVARAILDFKG